MSYNVRYIWHWDDNISYYDKILIINWCMVRHRCYYSWWSRVCRSLSRFRLCLFLFSLWCFYFIPATIKVSLLFVFFWCSWHRSNRYYLLFYVFCTLFSFVIWVSPILSEANSDSSYTCNSMQNLRVKSDTHCFFLLGEKRNTYRLLVGKPEGKNH
jgi:hypothetical protein